MPAIKAMAATTRSVVLQPPTGSTRRYVLGQSLHRTPPRSTIGLRHAIAWRTKPLPATEAIEGLLGRDAGRGGRPFDGLHRQLLGRGPR